MRNRFLLVPWLETEVALFGDASAVRFKVVFFLEANEANHHRCLVEVLVFARWRNLRYLYRVVSACDTGSHGSISPDVVF